MKPFFSFLLAVLFCNILSSQTPIDFILSNATVNNGQTFELDVRANNFTGVTTFQFSIAWNSTILVLDTLVNYNTTLPLSGNNFNFSLKSQGKLGATWFDANAKTLPGNDLLFKLKFKALSTGTSPITFNSDPVEIYAENSNGTAPTMQTNGAVTVQTGGVGTIETLGLSKLIVYPNPVVDRAILQFELLEDQEIGIYLFDNMGQLLREVLAPGVLSVGHSDILVEMGDMPKGVYYLGLNGVKGNGVLKVIRE